MRLLREVTQNVPQPALPEGGWNVGHLANHGILLTCDGFSARLDLNQLNVLFDYAESGSDGEIRDHDGNIIFVEVGPDSIVLSRADDPVYPTGVVLDMAALNEMGIEKKNASAQPSIKSDKLTGGDTIAPDEDAEPDAEPASPAGEVMEEEEPSSAGFTINSEWRRKKEPEADAEEAAHTPIGKKTIVRILRGTQVVKR